VRFSQLVVRNLRRSPLRAAMTVLTVAIMLSAFIFPRALVEAQEENVRQTPNNRVVTRAKLGWTGWMPKGYADRVREVPGVRHACANRWANFKLPGQEKKFFAAFGWDEVPCIAMHSELVAPEEQKQAFLADEHGAFVGDELAKEFGWKLGDRVIFESRQFPGTWELNISGIYHSVREGFGQRSLWLHYDFLNRGLPREEQDRVAFISAEVVEPNQGGHIAKQIDAAFEATPFATLSLEDRVLAQANLGNFQAILTALDVVSYLILVVVMTIVGNTVAMNVRERTHEYGVMRAIGFGARALCALVLGEAVLLGMLGAGLGLGISYPLFEGVVSRVLQEAMNFPPIVIPRRVAWLALSLGAVLSLLSGLMPMLRVSQLRVTDALRRIG
jgi:putative ABC transport system permease protein